MVRTDIDDNVVYVKEKDPLNQGLFTQLKISGDFAEYELVVSGVGGGLVVGDATTTVKGIVELALDGENTAGVVVQGNDSRLDDDRFPLAHAYTHKSAGDDVINLDELGVATDNTTLNATDLRHGLLPKLSDNPLHFLDGEGNWNIPPGAGTIPATETDAGIVELAADGESAAGLAVQANDSRLTNDRFPTDHATTHNKDGSDAFAKTDILHAIARFVETLGVDPTVDTGRIFINLTDLKYWDDTAGTPVKQTVEILSHKNQASGYAGLDGSSKVAVANLPAATTAAAGISELATSAETTAGLVVQASDTRLSDARTPTAHKTSHEAGGGDELHVDTIGSGTDNTTNNVSTSKHGLAPKAPNDTSKFLRGDAIWAVPPDVGEANTYSNAGVGGIGVTLTKAGVDLPFKSVKANSTKISITDGGGNNNVLVDAIEANFNLANIGGTAAWTQVSKTGSIIGDIADTTISSPAQYEVLMRNGSSKWINSKLDNNSIAASAAIAYSKLNLGTSIVNADISGSAAIAYSKLALSLSIVNADISASAAIAKSKLASLDIVNADVNASAGIVYSKLSLTGGIVNADVNASAAIAKSKLAALDIVNADVNASAAIAYSKLNLATSIVNADVSGSAAIAYTKLNLGTSIVNADIAVAAAIAYSKLALNDSIVNADINTSAAIAWSKISKTGSALSDLDDVDLTGIADGDSIMWDSGTSTWVVYTPGGGGGGATDLEGLTDVDLTTPAQYHVLQYGAGTDWVNALLTNNNIDAGAAIAWSKISKTGSTLGDIDDVNLTGLVDGQTIVWDDGVGEWNVAKLAPSTPSYLTLAANSNLTAERILTAGTNLSFTDGGAGSTLTVNVPDASTTAKGAVELATSAETTAGLAVQASDTRLSDARTPTAHAATHLTGGGDTIASATTSAKGLVELATSGENAADVVVQGNDARLSDSRTPSAHKASHVTGGSDAFVKTDVLAAPSRYLETIADPASDSGRIWINSNSQEIEYWDTTTGTPVQRTVANLLSAQEFKNKTIDASLQTEVDKFYVAPHVKEIGGMTPAGGTGASMIGMLTGVTNLGTQSQAFEANHGYVTTWTTTASTTVQGGLRSTAALATRGFNPYWRVKFALPATTNNRVWIGFTSNTTIVTTDTFIANADSGIGFGYRSSDANWSVFHNDGTVSSAMTVVSTGVAKDTAIHAVEFQFNDSVPNCVITFYGSAGVLSTTTVTTELPPSGTQLFMFRFVGPSTAAINTYKEYSEWYEHRKTTAPL